MRQYQAAPSVAIATLGCKVNQAESDQFARAFAHAGVRVVEFDHVADAYIINSCTVTHVADRKSRQLMRQARRANALALIVATGCYPSVSHTAVNGTLADLVVPNDDKAKLVAVVLRRLLGERRGATAADNETMGRTRAVVKIQDGCNSLCSFCIIPYARGRERSVPVGDVVDLVRQRVDAGHQEVVLTGVHVGTYGQDLVPRASLGQLVDTLLGRTAIRRLRLSSIEPWNFDLALLDRWPNDRLCRHFHLALQSGSDAVLQRMRRPYTGESFARLLETIRAKIPEVAISTDVIVGFPGETPQEFAESLRLVVSLNFALVHVFPYSSRPRTPASRMPGQIPAAVKRARVEDTLRIAAESAQRFRHRFLGDVIDVLYQRPVAGTQGGVALWEGLSDQYLRVLTPSRSNLTNRILATRLLSQDTDSLRGTLAVAAHD